MIKKIFIYFFLLVLTTNLMDMLSESHGSRVVNVASNAHIGASIDFDNINSEYEPPRTLLIPYLFIYILTVRSNSYILEFSFIGYSTEKREITLKKNEKKSKKTEREILIFLSRCKNAIS